jgi:hypothetical protein
MQSPLIRAGSAMVRPGGLSTIDCAKFSVFFGNFAIFTAARFYLALSLRQAATSAGVS